MSKFNPLSAFIGAAGSLASGAIQQYNTHANQRLQSKLNREEMAYSHQLQKSQQDWLMNVQYGKMVSGMRNAGLNPATANGTTPSVPSASSPQTGGTGPQGANPNLDVLGDILATAQANANIDATETQSKKNTAEAEYFEAKKQEVEADTENKTYENSPEQRQRRNRETDTRIENMISKTGLQDEQAITEGVKAVHELEKIGLTRNQSEHIVLQMANTRKELDLISQKIGTEKAMQAVQYALSHYHSEMTDSERLRKNLGFYSQQKDQLATIIENLGKQGISYDDAHDIAELSKKIAQNDAKNAERFGAIKGFLEAISPAIGMLGPIGGVLKALKPATINHNNYINNSLYK